MCLDRFEKMTALCVGLLVALFYVASCQAISFAPDSPFADRVLYVTQTSFPPLFDSQNSNLFDVKNACETDRPVFCNASSALPILAFSGSSAPLNDTVLSPQTSGLDSVFQDYCFQASPNCFNTLGRWYWWGSRNRTTPVLISEDWSNLLNSGPSAIGYRSGDPHVQYWTGVDASSGNARACTDMNVRWNSANFVNEPSVIPLAQGATIGSGFETSGIDWYTNKTVRCNETLPVLCACKSPAPTVSSIQFLSTGELQIRFDAPTNGMSLGTFFCGDLFLLNNGQSTLPAVDSGTCRFVSPFELQAVLPRNSSVIPGNIVTFLGLPTIGTTFTGGSLGRRLATKIRDRATETVPAILPIQVQISDSISCPESAGAIRLLASSQHAVCDTQLQIKILLPAGDAGRPLLESFSSLTVTPCFNVNNPWTFDEVSYVCRRQVTAAELDARIITVDTTGFIDGAVYDFTLETNIWTSVYPECPIMRSFSVSTTAVANLVADIIMPPSPLTFQQSQAINIVPDFSVDPGCFPKGTFLANYTLRYFWSVSVTLLSRRMDELSTVDDESRQLFNLGGGELFNLTTFAFTVPKHSLKSLRATQGSWCGGTSSCAARYTASFTVYATLGNNSEIIIGQSGVQIYVTATPLVVQITNTVNADGSVTFDASKTCDPDVAINSCLPGLGFTGFPNQFHGLYFLALRCDVLSTGDVREYRPCDPVNDFVGATYTPTLSPIVTSQPSAAPIALSPPPTPFATTAPTLFYNGVTTLPKLKPGVYRLTQDVMFVSGGSAVGNSIIGGDFCIGPSVTGFEAACLTEVSRAIAITLDIPNCTFPQVNVDSLPARVTPMGNGPLIIFGHVTLAGATVDNAVLWEVQDDVQNAFIPLSSTNRTTILDYTQFVTPATRPSLVIPPNTLQAERTYTFRLTANAQGGGCERGVTSVSKTVTFTVNGAPFGGSCDVTPLLGRSYETIFTVSTSGWLDTDLPLTYSFEFLSAGDDQPIPLSDFGLASSITTMLSSLKKVNNSVLVVAQDSLGAKASARSSFITLTPLYDPLQGTANLPLPDVLFNQLQTASPDDKLRTFAALGASAGETKDSAAQADVAYLNQWRKDVAVKTIDVVKDSRASFGGGGSIRQVSLQVNALLAGLTSEANLGEQLTEDVSHLIQDLVDDAKKAFSFAGVSGVGAADLLPGSFGGSLLNALSELSKGIEAGIQAAGLRRRQLNWMDSAARDLQGATDGYARTASNLREAVTKLITTLMQGYVPGTPPKTIAGAKIEIAVTREVRLLVGSSLTTLQLGNVTVSLPSSVLQTEHLRNQSQVAPIVDVALVRFRYNIRELVQAGNLPPGFDPKNVTVDGAIADNYTVQEMTSLLFISSTDSGVIMDPFDLPESLNITLPLPDGYERPNSTTIDLSCGAWDNSFNGWSADGCKVAEYTGTQVVCSCTHASDFAAWNAFIKNLGGGPVGIIVTVALIVVGIMLPSIVIVYIIFMFWAARQDKRDADGVHVGALLLLTKNKLRLRAKQRKFFQLLRDNAKAPQPLVVDLVKARQLKLEKQEALKRQHDALRRNTCYRFLPGVFIRWFDALKYDHSLFGVFNRFDPYYTRTQRVTVVTSVLCGNLFVSSFLFDLKTATDITFGFTVGVVFLSALVVSLPVKLIIRVLFRQSEAVNGSMMDRVTQIYRVSYVNQDILPVYASSAERADIEMILAFRQYYLAKNDLQNARSLLRIAQRKAAGKGPTVTERLEACWARMRGKRVENEDDTALLRKSRSIAQRVGLSPDKIENKGELDLDELQQAVDKASVAMKEASTDLKEKCRIAKEEWAKVPRKSARVETLRKQQSSIMRFAALLYDEADSGPPRERVKRCSPTFLTMAWVLVIAYLIGCLIFTSYWILAYTSIKSTTPDATARDASQVILAWLVASFLGVAVGLFVSEPIIQFVRFALMPACIMRFGNGIVPSTKKWSLFNKNGMIDVDDDDDESVKDGANKVADEDEESKQPKDKLMLAVRVETSDGPGSIRTKAAFQDEYLKQQKKKEKGETHIETVGLTLFDLAAEVVEAVA